MSCCLLDLFRSIRQGEGIVPRDTVKSSIIYADARATVLLRDNHWLAGPRGIADANQTFFQSFVGEFIQRSDYTRAILSGQDMDWRLCIGDDGMSDRMILNLVKTLSLSVKKDG